VNGSLERRIELLRGADVPWTPSRAARVSAKIGVRRRALRGRFLECVAVAVASTALLLGLIRVSADAREVREAVPAVENRPAPPAPPAAERVLYADGALGDGGYEASIQ
jgi:hypothetical protein